MALVTKNDVTQIFAIQAPEVDLPPTFANYPRGWDTARSNNGKPTIKQFNYIQQRTDQNVLWIHQNGAALPYDATMEYAEEAIVLKDGVLKKKAGVAWVGAVEFPEASTAQPGIVQLVNDLTTGGTGVALTAEMGKFLLSKFNTAFSGDYTYFTLPNSKNMAQPIIVIIGSVAASVTAGIDNIITFPFAFPNSIPLVMVCNGDGVAAVSSIISVSQNIQPSGFGWISNNHGSTRANYIAIGY